MVAFNTTSTSNTTSSHASTIIITTLGESDILCGRCKTAFHNKGNIKFRSIINEHIPAYLRAKSRKEKSAVIIQIAEYLHDIVGAKFLKPVKGGYLELSEIEARKKVGHAIRDMTVAKQKTTMAQHSIKQHITTTKKVVRQVTIENNNMKQAQAQVQVPQAQQVASPSPSPMIITTPSSSSVFNQQLQQEHQVQQQQTKTLTTTKMMIEDDIKDDEEENNVSSLKKFLLSGSLPPFLPAPRSFGGGNNVVTPESSYSDTSSNNEDDNDDDDDDDQLDMKILEAVKSLRSSIYSISGSNSNTNKNEKAIDDDDDMFINEKLFAAIEPLRVSFQKRTSLVRRLSRCTGDFEHLEMELLNEFDCKIAATTTTK